MSNPVDTERSSDDLNDWKCRYCSGTIASVPLAKYAADEWLDAALWVHEHGCAKKPEGVLHV